MAISFIRCKAAKASHACHHTSLLRCRPLFPPFDTPIQLPYTLRHGEAVELERGDVLTRERVSKADRRIGDRIFYLPAEAAIST